MEADHWKHKRGAEDNLENEQPLAKRFSLLRLDRDGNPYTLPRHFSSPRRPRKPTNDSMQLDNTKDKVYIQDIDAELSDTESEDGKLIFLPDIEKKFTKIPNAVLLDKAAEESSREMVLYNVPSSLSVPQAQDNVRRAIIEARIRQRERQLDASKQINIQKQRSADSTLKDKNIQPSWTSNRASIEDIDAMDTD
ncbi:MAG: hypothetical protein M1824_004781 [Vezdaea acicularis]|nr:MAG: hypothetical protein M1824_004781 [Vezdaea acicularis]